jgi:hypothetical protein
MAKQNVFAVASVTLLALFFFFDTTNLSAQEQVEEINNSKTYSVDLFQYQEIANYSYSSNKKESGNKFYLSLQRIMMPEPPRFINISELKQGINNDINWTKKNINKFSKLKSKGREFSSYNHVIGYFLIKRQFNSQEKNLISFLPPLPGEHSKGVRSSISTSIVSHPDKGEIFVVLLDSSGPIHKFSIYKFDPSKILKPFPFKYDSYQEWPSPDRPVGTFRRTTDGHPCSFTEMEIIAKKNGLLLYCRRAKEECPSQYYRYDFKRGTLKEAEGKEQK